MSNFALAVKSLSTLTIDEKLALNKLLCEQIRTERRQEAAIAGASFKIGDIIKFTKPGRGRNAGVHYVKVSGFNRAGTAIVGFECTKEGDVSSPSCRWTVANTACVKVG